MSLLKEFPPAYPSRNSEIEAQSGITFDVRKNLEKLETTFTVFQNGMQIFHRTLGALPSAYTLSIDGSYLAVKLCNSNSDDALKGFIFDVLNNRLIFSGSVNWGFVDDFRWEGMRLFVKNRLGWFEVGFDGQFIQPLDYYKKSMDAADTDTVYEIDAYLALSENSEEALHNVCNAMDRLISTQYGERHGLAWAAQALRRKGEALEKLGQDEAALECYVDAVSLNEKVGVKPKIKRLTKKLGIDSTPYPSKLVIHFIEQDRGSLIDTVK